MGKGYASWSTFFEAFKIVEEQFKKEKPVLILYFGDYDPSGMDVSKDLERRFEEFGFIPYFERLALTKDQIIQFSLPPMPLKPSDPRSRSFLQSHGNFAFELDALPPAILRDIVTEGIMKYLDLRAFERDQQLERQEKTKLRNIMDSLDNSLGRARYSPRGCVCEHQSNCLNLQNSNCCRTVFG